MAGSVDLGSVYATLDLRTKNFESGVVEAKNSLKKLENSFVGTATQAGTQFNSIANSIAGILKPLALVGLTGSLGLGALVKYGFESTKEIQKTTAGIISLTGSAEEAGRVINEMIEYVQGKPFDRLEVIQASRQLLAMGRTTKDLTGDIEILGRAVVLTGGDFTSLAKIYGIAASSNRIMSGELNQLEANGIPITQRLAESMGITASKVREMAEDGEIDFKKFRAALELALPADIVANASNTIDNKLKSLRASFRNLAFDILGVDFSKMDGEPLVEVGGLLDKITTAVDDMIKSLRTPEMRETFRRIGDQVANVAIDIFPKLIKVFILLLANLDKVIKAVVALAGAWAVFKALAIVAQISAWVGGIIDFIKKLKGATIAAKALSAVMAANPVTLVILAIAALVAGLVYLEVKYKLVTKALEKMKPVIEFVKNVYIELWGAVSDLGKKLGEELQPAIEFVTRNMEAFKKIGLVLIGVALLPLITTVGTLIAGAKLLTEAIGFITDHFEGLKQIVKTTLNIAFFPLIKTIEAVQWAMEKLGIDWNDIWNFIKDVTKKTIDVISKLIDNFKENWKQFSDFVIKVINKVKETWQDFEDKVSETVNKITGFIDRMKTDWEKFKNTVSGAVDEAGNKVDGFKQKMSGFKEILSNAFDNGEGTQKFLDQMDQINLSLVNSIETIIQPYQDKWDEVYASVSLSLENTGNAISAWVEELPNKLSGIWTSMTEAWDKAYASVTASLYNIGVSIKEFFTVENFSDIWNSISEAWNRAYEATKEFFKGLANRIKPDVEQAGEDTATNTADSMKKTFTSVETIRKIGDAILMMIGLAVMLVIVYVLDLGIRIGKAVIEGLGRGISSGAGIVWNAIKGVSDGIGNFFAGAWNWLYDTGRAIIQGLVNGIGSMFSAVKNKLGELTGKLTSWKGPESLDKKILTKAGMSVIDGFIVGLESRYGAVQKSLNTLTGDIATSGMADVSGIVRASMSVSTVGSGQAVSGSQASPVSIYGDINIANQQDADYLLQRLSRRQDLTTQGLVGA